MPILAKTLQTLEFPKVQNLLAQVCMTEGAKQKAAELLPMTNIGQIRRSLTQTDDAKRLVMKKGQPTFGNARDITGIAEGGLSFFHNKALRIVRLRKTAANLPDVCHGQKLRCLLLCTLGHTDLRKQILHLGKFQSLQCFCQNRHDALLSH